MRALSIHNPPRALSPFSRDLDEIFARFFGRDHDAYAAATPGSWAPPIESFLRDGELVVRVDVPGIAAADIDVSVDGDRLTVKGERKSTRDEDKEGRSYREVLYGTFERSVTLPWEADPDSVKAAYKDGVLEVSLKAPAKVGSRKIPVAQ